MFKRTLFALITTAVAGTLLAQEAYKWTDEDGVVHYSDRPAEGAEKMQLPRENVVQTAPPPTTSLRSRRDTGPEDESTEFQYESLVVSSPGNEETLWNIGGVLNVTVSATPSLRPGDRLRVYYDGTPRVVPATSFQIQEVWRGEHQLQAEIVDSTGKLMIRSEGVRFYVQQTSIN